MSETTTTVDTRRSTSSPASAGGPWQLGSPDGPTIGRSGQAHAPVSRSRRQASAKGRRTRGTSGQRCVDSLPPDDPMSWLESRWLARMAVFGSPEYELTLKRWPMLHGPSMLALRASARRTSDSGYGGWQTPTAKANQDSPSMAKWSGSVASALAGWPTPTVGNATGSQAAKDASPTGRRPDGSKATVSLNAVACLSGWATPTAALANKGVRTTEGGIREAMRSRGLDLAAMACLSGWASLASRDWKGATHGRWGSNARPLNEQVRYLASGPTTTSSTAPMGRRAALDPAFSRWLMGFPAEWDDCAPTATRLTRGSRRRSSRRISTAQMSDVSVGVFA